MQVIGVLPTSFDFASVFAPGTNVDLFTPYALSEQHNRNGNTLGMIGRLKPGVSVDQARTELVALGKQLTEEFPRRNTIRPRVLSLDEHVNGHFRPALIVLAFAVAAVMLIVALNLASLQFARMTARGRELALRLALGASRGRLIRQTLTESLVLATGGASLGVAIGLLATRYVSRLRAFDIPLLARVTVDVPALGAAAIVALVTGVVVGVLPALQAPADPNDALKEGTRGATRGGRHARVRSALVVTEIAAALVLLVASSLLLRSFVRVLDTKLGFAPAQLARLRVDPPTRLPDLATAAAYYDDVLRRVRAIPGRRRRVAERHAAVHRRSQLGDSRRGARVPARPVSGRIHSGHRQRLLPHDGHPDSRRPRLRRRRHARRAAGRDHQRIDGANVVAGSERDRPAHLAGKRLSHRRRCRGRHAPHHARKPVHGRSLLPVATVLRVSRRSRGAHVSDVVAALGIRAHGARADRTGGGERAVGPDAGAHRQGRVAEAIRRRAARAGSRRSR